MAFEKFKKTCEVADVRGKFVKKCGKATKDTPELDEEQLEDLEDLLETMSNHVKKWESGYFAAQKPILKYM